MTDTKETLGVLLSHTAIFDSPASRALFAGFGALLALMAVILLTRFERCALCEIHAGRPDSRYFSLP